MIVQMGIGAILIALTVMIHAIALDALMKLLPNASKVMFRQFRLRWRMVVLMMTVLGVFCAHIVQIWVWTIFYIMVGASPTLEEALYYSTSTFTTVGYGDVLLSREWRLLGALQSANGFILFGWSTAFIFEVMSRLYQNQKEKISWPGKN